tara:strand:- start:391 stop:2529 length:2139 start_codon:yes stop_codon:yes gene_type:complete
MPTALQFRRGTTSQNNSFTGVAGELTVDTDLDTIVVHDGSTAGGFQLTQNDAVQTLTNKTLTSPTINGGTFSGTFTGTISPGQVTTNSIVSNGSNADISIQPSGTGDVLLSALRVNGTTLDSSDSTKITIAENVDVTGTLSVAGALSSSTSLALASGATVTGIADEDNMASDSNTLLATQQSIKAYVDAQITAEDLDFQADSGGALAIDLDSETLTFTGGTGIDTSGSGNAVTFAIDSTVATLTGSQTLTNKTITSPTIATPTITGNATIGEITTNKITSNGSNADLSLQPSGTGDVLISALRVNGTTLDSSDSTKITVAEALDVTGALTYAGFTLPTTDGSDGQAIVTDGSKTLSFATVSTDANASDDTTATAVNQLQISNSPKTIDSFVSSFQDSALYYCVSKDYNTDTVNIQKVSVCHNDTDAFASAVGAKSGANTSGTDMTAFTAALTNGIVQVKAQTPDTAGGAISFLQFGLGDNTSTGTSGNVIISQNTDVDSAAEAIVTFAHGTFRGAKLFISINNNSKTEVGNMEALVVHDGSDAFIFPFNIMQTGDHPMLTLTAAIDGSNVVISGAGHETNLRVTTTAIMLKDTMVTTGTQFDNILAIAPTTISSTPTEIDSMAADTYNGAVYYTVSKNTSEDSYAVHEVFLALGPGDATVASGPFVSTKSTHQLDFTAEYKSTGKNTGALKASSTSGASTTVSAYRINALAK